MNTAGTDTANRIAIDGPLDGPNVERRSYAATRVDDHALIEWDHGGIATATIGGERVEIGEPVEIVQVDPWKNAGSTHTLVLRDGRSVRVADVRVADHVDDDRSWFGEWNDVEPCAHPPFVVNVEFDTATNRVHPDTRKAVRDEIAAAVADGSIIAKPIVGLGYRVDVEVVECSHCRDEGEDAREAAAIVTAAHDLGHAFGIGYREAAERLEAALDAKRNRWREILAVREPVGVVTVEARADTSKFREGLDRARNALRGSSS